MKTIPVTPHHYQLRQLGMFNAFLVREEDGFTLIDSCFNQAKAIETAARSLEQPIRRILLTHAHNDHASSVDALLGALPNAELLISEREARLLAGDHTLDPAEPKDRLRGDFVKSTAEPTRTLRNGDRVGSLRVIASPGHTPGHCSFLDERDGTLFTGDAWSGSGGLAVAGDLRPTFPFPAWGTWSRELALDSAERLFALKPARLCFGHGSALEQPLPAMEFALSRAGRRLKRPGTSSVRTPEERGF